VELLTTGGAADRFVEGTVKKYRRERSDALEDVWALTNF
jgi:hypothetical protein